MLNNIVPISTSSVETTSTVTKKMKITFPLHKLGNAEMKNQDSQANLEKQNKLKFALPINM